MSRVEQRSSPLARTMFSFSLKKAEEVAAAGLCFFLIYNISFQIFPEATTARLALAAGLFYAGLFRTSELLAAFRTARPAFILFIPALYAVPLYLLSGDYGVIARFLNLFLYAVVGAVVVVSLTSSFERALLIIFNCVVLQAIFIWLSFLSSDFKVFLDNNVVSSANFDVFYEYRAMGFSGSSGAALSGIQALGVMVIWLYSRFSKGLSFFEGAFAIFGTILVISSIVVVARTGLLLAGIFLLFIFFGSGLSNSRKLLLLVFFAGVSWFFFLNFYRLVPAGFNIDWFMGWVSGAITDRSTFEFLVSTFPKLDGQFMVGNGLVSLVQGVNPSGSDSGYGQFMFAYGLPMTIIFYASYAYILFRITNYTSLFTRVILTFLFLLIDFKEPFLMKYAMFTILMIIYLAHSKDYARPEKLKY